MKQKLRKENSMKKTINNLKFLWNYSNNSKHFFILVILLNIIKIIIRRLDCQSVPPPGTTHVHTMATEQPSGRHSLCGGRAHERRKRNG